jgi:exosortase D (VPLPA-CTERM-specific)
VIAEEGQVEVWKAGPQLLGLLVVVSLLLVFEYQGALRHMAGYWSTKEEYSHGVLIPFIVGFLIWQRKDMLARAPMTGAWLGVAVVVGGMLLSYLGEVSTLHAIVEYSFVIVLNGLALAVLGWRAYKIIMAPMCMLLFMVPLPTFILNNLSAELQLISSAIGVWVIKLFDISVALEGNVIDLGSMKLQVVEACNGLRYLFPLMVFGFITAYFFKAPLWKRVTVFASTIPLTIIMNSLRIGVIGVTVEYWGASMAEGFLHDFEGWFVFMICAFLLGAEMWLLTRMTGDRRPLREVFGLEMPAATPADAVIQRRPAPKALIASVAIIGSFAVLANIIPKRDEIIPAHENFASFPLQIATWNGRGDRLEQIVIDELDVSDYLLANYRDGQTQPINLYVAYYGSQRTGESAHSPRTCLHGGGWKITSLTQQNIDNAFVNGNALSVNRALIEMDDQKQLVYYWFQQRGRVINNEYLVKWYLFWDALTRNRTDGALVRITSPVPVGEDVEQVDQRMKRFAQSVNPLLNDYIPL